MYSCANNCNYYIRQDDGIVLERYQSGNSLTGAFNGNTTETGNKSCLSFTGFGDRSQGQGKQIQDLEEITIRCRNATATMLPADGLYLNIFVKHESGNTWTGVADKDCIVVCNKFPSPITNVHQTFTLKNSDLIWTAVVAGHCLSSQSGSAGALTTYCNDPTDTLFDGVVTDNGLPYQYQYGAITFCCGSSSGLNRTVVVIKQVTIKFKNESASVFDF